MSEEDFLTKTVKGIMKWFRTKERTAGEYQIPLDQLIARSMDRYRRYTKRDFPYCPQCFIHGKFRSQISYVKMEFRRSKISLEVPVRDDLYFKCLRCYHTIHAGIPISRVEAEQEVVLRGGSPWILTPTYRLDERDKKEIIERLSKLGYIE